MSDFSKITSIDFDANKEIQQALLKYAKDDVAKIMGGEGIAPATVLGVFNFGVNLVLNSQKAKSTPETILLNDEIAIAEALVTVTRQALAEQPWANVEL